MEEDGTLHKIRCISGFMLITCLLMTGCTKEKTEVQGETTVVSTDEKVESQGKDDVVLDDEKNIAAITAVLEHDYTVPNEEYIKSWENLTKKYDEIYENDAEGTVYTSDPTEGTPEREAYMDFFKKAYGPYFTDSEYDFYINSLALHPHHMGEDYSYEIKVLDIQVIKSKNPNTPLTYDFTVLVEYTKKGEKSMEFKITGDAICPEEGKIGRIRFLDDGGLQKQDQ
ncbi:hypothetical protein HMPREF1210_02890 [Paenisporosarcina sp. HGH0030]|nr:hypothetical protein HMPREF1210_02890 [Paenisporosarcina sp. HGH0030]